MILPKTELRFSGPLLLDGLPLTCPTCAADTNLTLATGRLPFPALEAWANCPTGHGWDEEKVSNRFLWAMYQARTTRMKADDIATTSGVFDGVVYFGELVPEWCPDDIRVAADQAWRKLVKPAAKRRLRLGRRAAKVATRVAGEAVWDGVKKATGPVTAAAFVADWQARTGTADPTPITTVRKCPSCKGKGQLTLKSNIHGLTVPCSLCSGTGERDRT
ncbi:hypothetical protein ACIRVF_15780 [Kitasatospora sp. NPDC101157]|uniref:hypothetical protein n=1 Tax=Kitasatospora sp. NPDC101157 TaxID=3364098 RepID=UPI00382B106F